MRFDTDNFKSFESLVAGTDYTYAFTGDGAAACLKALVNVIAVDFGLNPTEPKGLLEGLTKIFNLEFINTPDFENNRFILAPNHVADFDAIILGLLNRKISIVSKMAWVTSEKLKAYLDPLYDLYGLDRNSLQGLKNLISDNVRYFNDSSDSRHFLVFGQGTISDFNSNAPERISPVAQKISEKTGVPVINVFIEQVSLTEKTRIVFDKPVTFSRDDDFRTVWLERERAMQNSVSPAARRPKLTYKHSHNNNPDEEFFR
jgi:hypothetical protein